MNLSSEELETFKDILTDQLFGINELSPEIRSASTDGQKKDIQQRYDALRAESETKIRELLGNDGFEKYQEYTELSDTRYFINGFKESLSKDDQLTEEQEKALIEAMQKEPICSETDSDNEKIIFPSEIYTENNIAEILSMHKSYNEAFIKAAQDVLSPSQLVLLKGYLNKRHDNYENSLKSMVRRHDEQAIELIRTRFLINAV